ncbi:DNA topoisomerase 2-like isoform X2 [Setaria viridis]|uniref:DNA topoisomerase 2-like isoform X2 n=1 Tax=Setaria viridis TaxID=4556 RepID=UPI003B3AE935
MTHRVLTYVPGLYKIFDEILTYAADNKQRDPSMDSLRVEVDVDQCCISIYYNGRGVPIELHPEEGLYVPEMIFGHLSNYEEITGVKLANLFSTELFIETVDSRLEKKYKQVFSENLGKKSEPQITVCLQKLDKNHIQAGPCKISHDPP